MFDNNIPLFKKNFDAIDHVEFIHSNEDNNVIPVATYYRSAKELVIFDENVDWFNKQVKDFIRAYIKPKLNLKPKLKQIDRRKEPRGPKL